MEDDYEKSGIGLDVEVASYRGQKPYGPSIFPTHKQQRTNKVRQTPTVPLAVDDYQH